MKNLIFALIIIPFFAFSQIDKTIKTKVAIMQNFVKKDSLGETAFWQTKGKITFNIVKYTDAQNLVFKNLFIKQYQELLPIYKRMVVSENTQDTDLFVKTLIRQEDDYRNLLTQEQLKLYSDKMIDLEKNDADGYNSFMSLFFSDNLLSEYKYKFRYIQEIPKNQNKPKRKKLKK